MLCAVVIIGWLTHQSPANRGKICDELATKALRMDTVPPNDEVERREGARPPNEADLSPSSTSSFANRRLYLRVRSDC